MSAAPAGGNGTTSRTGRLGKSALMACADVKIAAKSSKRNVESPWAVIARSSKNDVATKPALDCCNPRWRTSTFSTHSRKLRKNRRIRYVGDVPAAIDEQCDLRGRKMRFAQAAEFAF